MFSVDNTMPRFSASDSTDAHGMAHKSILRPCSFFLRRFPTEIFESELANLRGVGVFAFGK